MALGRLDRSETEEEIILKCLKIVPKRETLYYRERTTAWKKETDLIFYPQRHSVCPQPCKSLEMSEMELQLLEEWSNGETWGMQLYVGPGVE